MAQYKIQQGDTLSALARKYGTSVDALMQMNPQIQDRDLIYYDRMMSVPGAGTPPPVAGPSPNTNIDNIPGGPSLLSVDDINRMTSEASQTGANFFSNLMPDASDDAVAYAQSQIVDQDKLDRAIAEASKDFHPKNIFSNLKQFAQDTGGNIQNFVANNAPPVTYDPFQVTSVQGPSTIEDTLSPMKESVIQSANKAGQAVQEIIKDAPDAIKGSLSSFANNEIAAILGGLNKADRFIKDGDLSFLMKKYSDSITDKAKEGAESFASNINIIRKDFVDTLSDFAQDNNLDVQSLVEAIDVDALYDFTGIKNRKKEREIRLAEQRRLELERQRRMAVNKRTSGVPISSYAQGGLAQQAKNVAAQGRYGDSMLLHVNPAEVAGLSQVMPLTVNPETGQPEAFLPFLLPLLGSVAAPALLGSTALGGFLGSAGLAALGSGLGTFAATGDAKKGLMSGLMGYGIGKALGAGASALGGKGATDAATMTVKAGDILSGIAGQQGTTVAELAKLNEIANPDLIKIGQTINLPSAVGSSVTTPLENIGTLAGAKGEGLKAFGTAMSKPSAYIPTYLGASGYGMMNSQEDFNRQMENLKTSDTEEYNRILAQHPEYIPMLSGFNQPQTYRGGRKTEQAKKEFKPTAGVEARDINPFFMAGFQPEVGYLKNLNPSSAQIVSGQSGYAFGTEGSDMPSMTAPFDPTQTAGYQSFYNAPTGQPYSIDPFQKQTFERGPAPVMPDPVPAPVTEAVADAEPNVPIYVPPVEETSDPVSSLIDSFAGRYYGEEKEMLDTGVPMNGMMDMTPPPPREAPTPAPIQTPPPMYMPDTSNLSREEIESGAFDPSLLGSTVASPIVQDYFAPPPPVTTTVPRGQDRARRGRGGRNRKAEGGKTYPNEGLEALAKEAPKAVEAMGYQEGGLTQEMLADPVTQEVIRYISGDSGNDDSVSSFVNKYGTESFMQLREMILQQMSGGQSQTEGLISGANMGGMTDDIPMTISGGPAAVSQGEYIVPADVVSGLGDGDTESGAGILDDMLDNVRMARTGTTKQAPRLDNAGGLMPA